MKRALLMVLLVAAVVACTGDSEATAEPTAIAPSRTPTPGSNARAGVTIWGGTAHIDVAKSRDCDDLQSWFDAADIQRKAYLDRFGPDDPDYEYAFEVMTQADDRMQDIGCYS
jgi:hypothetical protein